MCFSAVFLMLRKCPGHYINKAYYLHQEESFLWIQPLSSLLIHKAHHLPKVFLKLYILVAITHILQIGFTGIKNALKSCMKYDKILGASSLYVFLAFLFSEVQCVAVYKFKLLTISFDSSTNFSSLFHTPLTKSHL